jgi:hypothetical protein
MLDTSPAMSVSKAAGSPGPDPVTEKTMGIVNPIE